MKPEHLVRPVPDGEHGPDPAGVSAWEVVDASGQVVYRGRDLGLADEIYLASPGGHLRETPGPGGPPAGGSGVASAGADGSGVASAAASAGAAGPGLGGSAEVAE
jgi:hypothetical protein